MIRKYHIFKTKQISNTKTLREKQEKMNFQNFLIELKFLSQETFPNEADFLLNGSNRGSETERKIHALAIG